MNLRFFLGLVGIIALTAACADSQQSESKRGSKKPSTTGDGTPEGGGSGGETSTPLDCAAQWALALKQQPVGTKFEYKGDVKSLISISVSRTETVTASSETSITHSSSDLTLGSYGTLKLPSITIQKTKFMQTCEAAGGQIGTFTGLGGEIKAESPTDDVISLQGKQIKVKRFKAKLKNISYGTYTIQDADAVTYVSPDYPIIPLKQEISIIKASLNILNGATINETLSSSLPVN